MSRNVTYRMRISLVAVSSLLFVGVAGMAFWWENRANSLPTPIPEGIVFPDAGAKIRLPAGLEASEGSQRLVLVNFFNPDCPCSRFNAAHVRELAERFGAEVRFVPVMAEGSGEEGAARWLEWFGLPASPVRDRNGAIAKALGVYSTPQAVLLESTGSARGEARLLYRGNYNRSRFERSAGTEYVRLSIEASLSHRQVTSPPEAALSYGCPIPRRSSSWFSGFYRREIGLERIAR